MKSSKLHEKHIKTDEILRNIKQQLKKKKNEKGVWAKDTIKRFKYDHKDE